MAAKLPPADQTLDLQYMADGWAYRFKGARQKQG